MANKGFAGTLTISLESSGRVGQRHRRCPARRICERRASPAQQLVRIDPQPKRAATLLGVTLLQLQRFKEAEKVLGDALRNCGEDGVLMTNLAKVQSGAATMHLHNRRCGMLWRSTQIRKTAFYGIVPLRGKPEERTVQSQHCNVCLPCPPVVVRNCGLRVVRWNAKTFRVRWATIPW